MNFKEAAEALKVGQATELDNVLSLDGSLEKLNDFIMGEDSPVKRLVTGKALPNDMDRVEEFLGLADSNSSNGPEGDHIITDVDIEHLLELGYDGGESIIDSLVTYISSRNPYSFVIRDTNLKSVSTEGLTFVLKEGESGVSIRVLSSEMSTLGEISFSDKYGNYSLLTEFVDSFLK